MQRSKSTCPYQAQLKGKNCKKKKAIGIFLFKMKLGQSYGLIATIIEFKSHRKVAHIIPQERTALAREFILT